LGKVEQATVAGRVCAHRRLGKQAAHHVGGGRGEGVAVGVDADHPINGSGQPSHSSGSFLLVGLVVSAWRTPRGASVTGHNPRVGQAAHQASKAVGQVDAGTTADNSSPRQPGWAPEPL
jgi:hypothetical protein